MMRMSDFLGQSADIFPNGDNFKIAQDNSALLGVDSNLPRNLRHFMVISFFHAMKY
jgi:hypothetical protein